MVLFKLWETELNFHTKLNWHEICFAFKENDVNFFLISYAASYSVSVIFIYYKQTWSYLFITYEEEATNSSLSAIFTFLILIM